jgi:hypothetical protein
LIWGTKGQLRPRYIGAVRSQTQNIINQSIISQKTVCNHKICLFQILSEYCLKNNWGEPTFNIMTIKSLQEGEVYMCRVSCMEIVGGECGVRMCGVCCEETGGDECELFVISGKHVKHYTRGCSVSGICIMC